MQQRYCSVVQVSAVDNRGGAARVGMTPVLYVPRGEPYWAGLEGWAGLRITSLEQVLTLV